jgi:hypothetical protein
VGRDERHQRGELRREPDCAEADRAMRERAALPVMKATK